MKRGLLRCCAARPSTFGLEVHISMMLKEVDEFHPQVVVLDAVSSFEAAGTRYDALGMLMRLIDRFKSQQISALLVGLTGAREVADHGGVGLPSLIDGWILLRSLEQGGERTRALYVLKAREQIHVGPDGILVGSARSAQQLRDRIAARLSRTDIEQRKELLGRKRSILKSRIAELETEYAAQAQDLERVIQQEIAQQESALSTQAALAAQRETLGAGVPLNRAGRAQ